VEGCNRMNKMEIQLRTLTPLWTGGVDQTFDRLHETGLIGSLRWWYEALVRGMGGSACDPTESKCTFEEERYRKSKANNERQRLREAGLCDVCQLFGATGWGRKFRLRATSEGQRLLQQNETQFLIPSGRIHQTRGGSRAGGWFVFSESRMGEVTFELIPLRDVDLQPVHIVLTLISRYASLGPKGASGYGVIEAKNLETDLSWVNVFGDNATERNNALPDFRDLFFAKFQFKEPADAPNWWQSISGIREAFDGKLNNNSSPRPLRKALAELIQMHEQGILPVAPAIRNWLRYKWNHGLNHSQEQFVFGDARSAIGSKILVSYAYRTEGKRWEFRVWGWLPCKGQLSNRDSFLNSLKEVLGNDAIWKFVFVQGGIIPKMKEWHARDCSQNDGGNYLEELLGGAP